MRQLSLGIQHQAKGTLFEARYVGNHMVGRLYGEFDFNNQVVINQNCARRDGLVGHGTKQHFDPNYEMPPSPAASN